MSNKKHTAVDWLENRLIESGISFLSEEIEFINQAKEMEKQQKIDAYNQGRHNGQVNWGVGNDITAEQYYKENYE
jgi:RNA polymerase-interacting CarD/CdnL/TRCF family regulator